MKLNDAVAEALETLADALEFKGENIFKLRAYRKAARVLRELGQDVAALAREKRLRSLPGVGEGIARKIAQFIETGRIDALDKALAAIPTTALEIMRIPGVGPRVAAAAFDKLGVTTVSDFIEAVHSGKLVALAGISPQKADNIQRAIAELRPPRKDS